MEIIEGTAIDATDEDRRRTVVGQHPDRDAIEHLLRRGKSGYWIQLWLEERYPVATPEDDEDGDDEGSHLKLVAPAEEAKDGLDAINERLQLGASVIDEYRERFLPECQPGVDVINEDLEDLIGRKFPGTVHWELDVMETGVHVAQHTLAKSLANDEEMGMVQQTTLDANDRMISAAERLLMAKQRLGMPGYEPMPEHIITENTNKNVSIELHGRVDPKTGKVLPAEPEKLSIAKALLSAPPDKRAEIMAAAHAAQDAAHTAKQEPSGDNG